ncbi:MAG TPA: F0F1 ATP synthase subunit A, partial [Nocardioidaceae bacterium]
MSAYLPVAAESDIEIGEHHTFEFLGMTFNADTIWSTAIAAAIVLILGLFVARGASSRSPGKMQLLWELLVDWVTTQVEANLGKVNPFVVPLAIALFVFILVCNWLELIPTHDWLKSPT